MFAFQVSLFSLKGGENFRAVIFLFQKSFFLLPKYLRKIRTKCCFSPQVIHWEAPTIRLEFMVSRYCVVSLTNKYDFLIWKFRFLSQTLEIRSTTTTPSTTISTAASSTTLRTSTRRKYYEPTTSTSTLSPTTSFEYTAAVDASTDIEMEFVTDFPGSHSLFYPGVESYQHHINYINSQSSFHDTLRLHRFSMSLLFLLKIS